MENTKAWNRLFRCHLISRVFLSDDVELTLEFHQISRGGNVLLFYNVYCYDSQCGMPSDCFSCDYRILEIDTIGSYVSMTGCSSELIAGVSFVFPDSVINGRLILKYSLVPKVLLV